MKTKILQLIASSQNSNELADRICELVEEREKKLVKAIQELESWEMAVATGTAGVITKDFIRLDQVLDVFHPASPKDSRRDVGKGKKME